MLNSRKSLFLVLNESKVNQISVWVCKPKYANYILAFKNLCWKNHCVQVWKTCWVFPIWHKWSILAFFLGKCCTEDLIKEFRIGPFPKCLEKTDFHSRPERHRQRRRKKLTVFWTIRIKSRNGNWTTSHNSEPQKFAQSKIPFLFPETCALSLKDTPESQSTSLPNSTSFP